MSLDQLNRLAPQHPPTGQLVLQQPPELPKPEGATNTIMMAVPMLGSMGSIAVIALAGEPTVRTYLMGGMFLFIALAMVGGNMWRQRSTHETAVRETRREYLAYLSETRETVRETARRQRAHGEWIMPAPESLPFIAEEGTRVWERRGDQADRLIARVGTSTQPLALELEEAPTPALAQLDPVSVSAAHRFVLTHELQPGMPHGIDLGSIARLEIAGPANAARGLARSIATQLATFASPDLVQIAVLASPESIARWEWVKWLPHAHSTRSRDAVGSARMVGETWADIEGLAAPDIASRARFQLGAPASGPHLVLIVDGGRIPAGHPLSGGEGVQGVTVIDLPATWDELQDRDTIRLLLGEGDAMHIVRRGLAPHPARADRLGVPVAEATARRLMPRLEDAESEESGGPARAISAELTDLLGLPNVTEFDPAVAWRPRLPRDRLRVPIGLTATGQPMILDIKESAQQGMGPHGLLIGATGSGKSEVLRTLVLSLALTHSSEDLNFVLVDFKGGATFAGMADMPHVSAIITNLGDDLTLVDRMQDAITGEMVRRQELLRDAGNFANVADYETARKGGRDDLDPLPALFIVADEFSELLSAKPEFADLFVAIGRLGRSLQMHLLLSTQRLEEGKLRGLESHLSYRVGLKTFSASDSRTVIGVPDAFSLPGGGGHGILKSDSGALTQFRAAYVSAPPKATRRKAQAGAPVREVRVEHFSAAPVISRTPAIERPEPEVQAEPTDKRATFDIAVSRMAGKGRPAHQVWLPPFDLPPTMDELMPDLAVDPSLGLLSPAWRSSGTLRLPIGMVDRPLEQRRDTFELDLGGAGGHLAIVGGARSGKSTLARTVVAGLALTNTPAEVQVYVMDFGGGAFTPMQRLEHVAGVATRTEPDVLRRMYAEILGIVNTREEYFRHHGIDSIETYRRMRREGTADDGYGDLFLVVDGWPTLRAEFDQMEIDLQTLAGRGLTFGLHLIATTSRWMDFRTAIRDVFGSKIELRLGDPMDSEIDRKIAKGVPVERPGRGLTMSGHHFLAALPRIDGDPEDDTLTQGVDDLMQRISQSWTGPSGPKLRLLPDQLPLAALRSQVQGSKMSERILLGIDEAAFAPVGLDPRRDSHLYLLGDIGSGKSSFLRGISREIQRLATPKEAQIFVVDYRRALLSEISEEYLAGYFTTAEQATGELRDIAAYLQTRLPGPDVTPKQLRERSWWTGADVYVLVDDYDLVASASGNPISALQPLLAQAGDVGLHLIMTRRSGGASRALYEPVLQSLRDLAVPGILLSGSPDEGPLLGSVKPRPAVPGRAQLVTRERGLQTLQLAYAPPSV
ncbi:type VII secretion protein EccCa [Homoserinibacter sp. YIM 151385]|uniref:type VII secretion protein EccCa n=1 Tax=Homoserinibacter sp. YIM 151385 TaxID=2985506 RepID=UPI0022F05A66|nr:type VII secretion protein EccCa [Homoserinibacter sp. YIM 151385]WBU38686.1 type VII secretion protein EccCa [Homoserinibacter sp. YIM 151385]